MVIAAEVLNTSIEALCDKVCPEYHHLIEVAKDAAAGAVLVLAITSAHRPVSSSTGPALVNMFS